MKPFFCSFLTLLFLTTNYLSAQSLEFIVQQQLNTTASTYNLSAEDVSEWTITDQHISPNSGVQHIYIRQQYQGLEIVGANAALHLLGKNAPLSFHNNFVSNAALNISQANTTSTTLSAIEAVQSVADQLGYRVTQPLEIIKTINEAGNDLMINNGGISLENIPAKLVYQADSNGNLKLAWDISILELNHLNWWSIRVDAATGQILDKNNWTLSCNFGTSDECEETDDLNNSNHTHKLSPNTNHNSTSMTAAYNVYAVPVESPSHGGRTIISDPSDATASPYGWHDDNGATGAEYTITRGNNVHAQEDINGNNGTGYSPDGGEALNFNYAIDLTQAPSANQDANITNLFYWNNIIHDVAYRLGFNEASGNFQENNYGKGGSGSDFVYADAQDGSGSNNANFSTPPDGFNPRMQMFNWTAPNPDRDGDLDNGIILHEYGHGISIRLTGGASTSSCLSNSEQMGEGWSDYWGVMLTMKDTDQGTDKRGVGTYALNEPITGDGIREFPYSTDMSINSHTYDRIKTASVPHGVGSVWCGMLWEMSWGLIEQHGFNADLYLGTGGNNIAMQLVMEGLKLQPCSPGFVDGRDAILKADTALYGGANSCIIWKAFAKRGLGYSADQGSSASASDGTQAFDLPPGVNENCTTDPDYAIVLSPNRNAACAGNDFTYEVSILAFNGYTGTVTISPNSLPVGLSYNLSQASFNTFPASATWTITNTDGLAAGDYSVGLGGTDGSTNRQKTATLEILPIAAPPVLLAPANNSSVTSLKQTLQWTAATGATHYDLQMATDNEFTNLVINVTGVTGTAYTTGLLNPATTYYWRMKSNSCSVSDYATASFSTTSACGQSFTDSGGAGGNHQNNELLEWIFCPDNPGQAIRATFSSFSLETSGTTSCWDDLTIYNGNSTSAPSLGAFCGTSIADLPNNGIISASNASGCLTFVFDSDGSVTRSGWEAIISCLDCSEPVVNTIEKKSENCAGSGDGRITVTATAVNPVEFLLTPASGGATIINTTGVFADLSAGDYSLVLRTQGDPDCATVSTTVTLTASTPTITDISIVAASCENAADGMVAIDAEFGTALTYLLTPTSGTIITNTTGNFTNLNAGTYTVAVHKTDDVSCISPTSTILINTSTTTPPTIEHFELCLNESLAEGEGLKASCGGEICNAITLTSGKPINATNTTVCETITVNGNAEPVNEIYLSFVVQHAWVGDLSATLESPDGTVISLFNAPGIPNSTYGCSQNNLNLIFADTASGTAAELESTCNASTGTMTYAIAGAFQPIDLFSTLNGENANGDWKICFYDSFAGADHGLIEKITLIINPEKSTITWWDAAADGNLLHTGATFDPIADNHVASNRAGSTMFWAQCECAGCPSQRTAATFVVSGQYYFLDNDGDGYGDANNSRIVCNGDNPLTNYITNFTDCDDGNSDDVMMQIDNHPVSTGMHQANAMISSAGMIQSGGSLVTFQAGSAIILSPGFHAQAGSSFLAKIDSCGALPTTILSKESTTFRQINGGIIATNPASKIDLKIFPNPFRQRTQIAFQLAKKEQVSLMVYDGYGRLVQSYYQNEWQEAGDYQVTFEAKEFSTGVFIAVLRTGNDLVSRRVVLVR